MPLIVSSFILSERCTDPMGALPPALGKRNLEAFRELGRAAAAQMKYVPIADEDSAPKRGCGGATEEGQGFVVFPRGDAVSFRFQAEDAPKVID